MSSGALIDSISYGASIIGPNVGAFNELKEAGIIKTYENFEDLMVLLGQLNNLNNPDILKNIFDFVNENTWQEFSKVFEKRCKSILIN